MSITYVYPQEREIRQIGQTKLSRALQDRVGFSLMPLRDVPHSIIQWTQKDNYRGLQALRGLDGAPFHVKMIGDKTYVAEPGVFGDFMDVSESELTTRAGSVQGDIAIDVTDLVLERQDTLLGRELDRIEQIIWLLLTTGTFAIVSQTGVGLTFTDTFTIQTLTGTDWSNPATATPLADFKAVGRKAHGLSVNLGPGAQAVMNQVTFDYLLANTNDADFFGKIRYTTTVLGIGDVNRVFGQASLPTITVYDEGYFDDSGTFINFIADRKVVVVGRRPNGEVVGEYRRTRNAQNPGFAPGSYEFVQDRTGNAPDGQRQVPASIRVNRGHNGGPVIYFPSAICVMSV